MNKRPLSVTVIACIFIGAGVIGFAYHVAEFKTQGPFEFEIVWVCLLRVLAIVGGVFLIRGHNWARWLLLLWIAYHVILSASHSLSEVVTHGLLFAIIGYFLFRPRASAYFRRPGAETAQRVIKVRILSQARNTGYRLPTPYGAPMSMNGAQ